MQDYFDQVAERMVSVLDEGPIKLPDSAPSIVKHAYFRTWALTTPKLKAISDDTGQLKDLIAKSLSDGMSIALKEIGSYYKKNGYLVPETPTHWYLTFSDRCGTDERFWVVFFSRALMLLGEAEDELDVNPDEAFELIIEAHMTLDAGLWACERSHGEVMDEYAIHVHQNYDGVIAGVKKKKQTDAERTKLLDSLVAKVEQRCVEFQEAGVLDNTDMKYHCDHVCREVGARSVKRLQNRCSELGLGKRFFPGRSHTK